MSLHYVKDLPDKTKDCGNCYYFSTAGMLAPSGWCKIHKEFEKDICMSYSCFPDYATICDDFNNRDKV